MRSLSTFLWRRKNIASRSLHLPVFTKEGQLSLLRSEMPDSGPPHKLGELVVKHLGGHIAEAHRFFSITKSEYLAWAKSLPISAFAHTEFGTRDGTYLIHRGNNWVVVAQEREMACWELSFPTKEAAVDYLHRNMCPYNVFKHLNGDA